MNSRPEDFAFNGDMEEETESFAELLDAYGGGADRVLQVGDKVRGKIISIGKENIFVDTRSKIDGIVETEELLDENGRLPYQKGDEIELYVMAVEEAEIKLSKAVSGIGGLNLLREAYHGSMPVEGKVTEPCKGGFVVEILKRRAFCPISQIDAKYVDKPDDYVGERYPFLITQLEENGRNIVLSRRKILEAERKKAREEFFEHLEKGAVLHGKVSNVMPYGAFIELIPGVEGMAHISELSWSKTQKTEDLLKKGEEVTVKVLDILDDPKGPRISLSLKQLTRDPWESAPTRFKPGDKLVGTVTRCAPFGAFVELAPGVEGLVHLSEMSYLKRVRKAEDVVRPGENVSVLIKDIDEKQRRISLSIKDAEGDPWVGAEAKYIVGNTFSGILEKKETFGYFVQLEPGVTGLIPKSKLSEAASARTLENVKEGASITVVVESIDTRNHKMTLAPGDRQGERDWKKFADDSSGGMGLLGEKLSQALRSGK
ncbi:MAG: 30S ribosomal protein S1 [Desulfobacterales bacterium]